MSNDLGPDFWAYKLLRFGGLLVEFPLILWLLMVGLELSAQKIPPPPKKAEFPLIVLFIILGDEDDSHYNAAAYGSPRGIVVETKSASNCKPINHSRRILAAVKVKASVRL